MVNLPEHGLSGSETTGGAPDGGAGQRYRNQLIDSTSPYLLQHAHNPVNWMPWGREALELSRAQDKPIFLSIGYAACHWCHVMEREVFEKPEIAAVMNEHFVNIKVDREERPDLDELYMLATQLMTGSGGWPMSVWLTPELEPFYAGTYFPAEDGYGRPGFVRLERALADSWKNRRGELREQAKRVVEAVRGHADESGENAKLKTQNAKPGGAGAGSRTGAWVQGAVERFADRFDAKNGGLGAAPKFPPHQALQFWLAALQAGILPEHEAEQVRTMIERTLDGMMNGGIYDHVGGGFARYSTDERWFVPHFEKMLYDGAQLAPVYAAASVQFARPEYARVACETLDFFLREMAGPRGEFYSSMDADSEGEEGKYYVWTMADLRAGLPFAADAALIVEHLGMQPGGNWPESPVAGGNVLAVVKSIEAMAGEIKSPRDLVRRRMDEALAKMRVYRKKRIAPGMDDKILTAWNGLMVSALAVSGRILRESKYLEAAHRLIGFLLTAHMEQGRRLLRVSRNGTAHIDGFLDDHAYLLNGLMDLIDSTTASSLPGTMARRRALEMADEMIRGFEDREGGGFFFTQPEHEALFARMKNAADNATPSANGVAIRAFCGWARMSGKEKYRETAMRAVGAFTQSIERHPDYFPTILLGLLEERESATKSEAKIGGADAPSAFPLPPEDEKVPLDLTVKAAAAVKAGESLAVELRLAIPEGFYIRPADPHDPEAFKTFARMRTRGPGGEIIASQQWTFPEPEQIDGGAGYRGTIDIKAVCGISSEAAAGTHVLRITLLAQPCSATACYAPERAFAEFMVRVDAR